MGNKTLIFKKVPTEFPVPGEHLTVEDRPVDLSAAPKGGILLEILSASYDPYLRGRMRDASVKSYSPPFELNGPVTNDTIARVLKSDSSEFKEGDLVRGHNPLAEYAQVSEKGLAGFRKVDNPHNLDLGLFLGALGMPGLTAYSSLHKIGKPKNGETIFVSSAAGAVGQIVGQVAKREGLTVIGSVGSDEKLDFIIKELGFDSGFNYKKEKPADALARLAPKGIDIYYENVGGDHLDAALTHINVHGRIVACGMINEYNKAAADRYGVKSLMNVVAKQLTFQGFIVSNPEFGPAYYKEHQENLQKWLSEGSVKAKISLTNGIDKAAEGFVGMLKGENFGKAVLKIKE